MRNTTAAAIALLTVLTASGASAQDFNWRSRIDRGKSIEIKGVNGDVRAVAASGAEVRVSARKTARDDNPDDVKIEVVEHADGVTICAVYPTRRGRAANECKPGSGGRMSVQNNDVKVAFTVEVPAGVALVARTVNGRVEATSLGGDIHAVTVNGDVEVSTTGIARATTVNGSITASMGRADWSGELEFETVNGSIELALGGDVNADVRASTVNGGISTDFPLTVQGRFGPRNLNGTIGRGGRTLKVATVNGEIELKRR